MNHFSFEFINWGVAYECLPTKNVFCCIHVAGISRLQV